MKISAEQTALLIVDVQEKLVGAMHDPDKMIDNCERLAEAATALGVPLLVSEQYPKGLGPTVKVLSGFAGTGGPVEKVHFSCMADDEYQERYAQMERDKPIIVGIEAHVCVLQTALDLVSKGQTPIVVADAVTSRTSDNKMLALDRLRANGVEIVSTEMVIFEWLHTSQNPAFKSVSKLLQ